MTTEEKTSKEEVVINFLKGMARKGNPVFTYNHIIKAWREYGERRIIREQKQGEWSWKFIEDVKRGPVDATKREVTHLKFYMSFPEYLLKYWNKK